MFTPRLNMDRGYTVFGRVVGGMNYVDAIERGEPPPAPSRIIRASLGSDNLPPLSAAEIQADNARVAAAVAAAPAAPAQTPLNLPTRRGAPVAPAQPAPQPAPQPQ